MSTTTTSPIRSSARATPAPGAAARRTCTRARPGSGSSRSTPHRRAASSAPSSSRAWATSTATSTPDFYVGDYADTTNGIDAAGNPAGRAGVYSGRDGHELLSWLGDTPEAGLGPGRGAGDVNGDGRPDLIVGSYTSNAGAPAAGKVQIFSGADGSLLRTITSTVENDNLGFDAVGLGDTNRDGVPDELLSAANGNHVYIVAGNKLRKH